MIKIKIKQKKHKEHFIGGAADNIPYSHFNQKELEMGKEKEMRDHGMPASVATEIAADELETDEEGYVKELTDDSDELNEEDNSTVTIKQLYQELHSYTDRLWIFFDTETTGIEPADRQLTEIAALVTNPDFEDNGGIFLGEYDVMVKLSDDTKNMIQQPFTPKKKGEKSISEILEMTKYFEKLKRRGIENAQEENEAISNFYKFLDKYAKSEKIVLLAHNSKFDKGFINGRAAKYSLPEIKYDVYDTLKLMQQVYHPLLMIRDEAQRLPKLKNLKGDISFALGIVAKAHDINTDNWHSAKEDVKMLIQVVKNIVKEIKENLDLDVTVAHKQLKDKEAQRQARFASKPTVSQTTEATKKKAAVVKPSGPSVEKTKNIWLLSAPPAAGKSTWFRSVFNIDPSTQPKQYGLLKPDLGFISEDAILDSKQFQQETKDEFISLLQGKAATKFKNDPEYIAYLEQFKQKLSQDLPDYKLDPNSSDIQNNVTSVDIYGEKGSGIRQKRVAHTMKRFHAESKQMVKEVFAQKPKNIVVDRLHASKKTRATSLKLINDSPEYKAIFVSKTIPQADKEKEDLIGTLIKRDYERSVASKGARAPMARSRIEDVVTSLSKEPPGAEESEGSQVLSLDDIQAAKKLAGSTVQETLNEYNHDKYIEWLSKSDVQKDLDSKLLLSEVKLSEYWKMRAHRRATKAGRKWPNITERDWAIKQQEESMKINSRLTSLFEKELGSSNDLIEELTQLLKTMKSERKKMKSKNHSDIPPSFGPNAKPKGNISTERVPGKGITADIERKSKAMKRKAKGSATYAGSFGPMGEGKDENK